VEIERTVSRGSDSWNCCSDNSPVGSGMLEDIKPISPVCYPEMGLNDPDTQDSHLTHGMQREHPDRGRQHWASSKSTTFAEFVEFSFIPEFVATKRYAGRAHFQAILKYVLPPERVARAFGANGPRTKCTLTDILDWPYIDRLRLPEITPDVIHLLTTAALARGYSIQTATHIRNVIRSIFAHAIRTGFYADKNPASMVALPPMARRQINTLTLGQLKVILQSMRYPEREVALFIMLTEMNVAEICGLQWRYINTSGIGQIIGQEFIPARSIAVRNQSYRGELTSVAGKRRRFTRMPELLGSVVHELKSKSPFTLPHDFVLFSRNGAPIRPENILARRLKPIGRSFNLPWLSWSVFNQTEVRLRSQIGRTFDEELKSSLFHSNHAAGLTSSFERNASL
jgi:integrase